MGAEGRGTAGAGVASADATAVGCLFRLPAHSRDGLDPPPPPQAAIAADTTKSVIDMTDVRRLRVASVSRATLRSVTYIYWSLAGLAFAYARLPLVESHPVVDTSETHHLGGMERTA
jgi:hypothetical protein